MEQLELDGIKDKYRTGLLTAVKGTNIPMTVHCVSRMGNVCCIWFDKDNKLNKREFPADTLVGAGDQLIFENGVFVGAQIKVRGDVPL